MSGPSIRASSIQSASAGSYAITWPIGTLAGDKLIVIVAGGFFPTPPNGWCSILYVPSGTFQGVVIEKVMTAADIVAGGVTITMNGTFNTVITQVALVAGTFGATMIPRYVLFGGNPQAITAKALSTSGLMLYSGSNRGTSTNTVSRGAQIQQLNASNASGCLYWEIAPSTAPTPSFSYSSNGSGNWSIALYVSDPTDGPSWLQGTREVCGSASNFNINLPYCEVGDKAYIFVGSAWQAGTPTGWSNVDINQNSGWNLQVFEKTIASGDLTGGALVNIILNGNFDLYCGAVTVKASAIASFNARVEQGSRNGSSGTPRTINFSANGTLDGTICFGSSRSNSDATCNVGQQQQQTKDGSAAGGCIYCGAPAAGGTQTASFAYSAGGGSGGDAQSVINYPLANVAYIPQSPRAQRAVYLRR